MGHQTFFTTGQLNDIYTDKCGLNNYFVQCYIVNTLKT